MTEDKRYELMLKSLEANPGVILEPLTQEEKDNRIIKIRLVGAIRQVTIEAIFDYGEEQ